MRYAGRRREVSPLLRYPPLPSMLWSHIYLVTKAELSTDGKNWHVALIPIAKTKSPRSTYLKGDTGGDGMNDSTA